MSDLDFQIQQHAQKAGVPLNLARALVRLESGGRQNNISRSGAIGLTQLMPGTARALGVNPNNADQNLDGGFRYYGQQLARFHDPDLAYAAYNAGPDAVIKAGNRIPQNSETPGAVRLFHQYATGGNAPMQGPQQQPQQMYPRVQQQAPSQYPDTVSPYLARMNAIMAQRQQPYVPAMQRPVPQDLLTALGYNANGNGEPDPDDPFGLNSVPPVGNGSIMYGPQNQIPAAHPAPTFGALAAQFAHEQAQAPTPDERTVAQSQARAAGNQGEANYLQQNPAPQFNPTLYSASPMPVREQPQFPNRVAPAVNPWGVLAAGLGGLVAPSFAGEYAASPIQAAVNGANAVYQDNIQRYREGVRQASERQGDALLNWQTQNRVGEQNTALQNDAQRTNRQQALAERSVMAGNAGVQAGSNAEQSLSAPLIQREKAAQEAGANANVLDNAMGEQDKAFAYGRQAQQDQLGGLEKMATIASARDAHQASNTTRQETADEAAQVRQRNADLRAAQQEQLAYARMGQQMPPERKAVLMAGLIAKGMDPDDAQSFFFPQGNGPDMSGVFDQNQANQNMKRQKLNAQLNAQGKRGTGSTKTGSTNSDPTTPAPAAQPGQPQRATEIYDATSGKWRKYDPVTQSFLPEPTTIAPDPLAQAEQMQEQRRQQPRKDPAFMQLQGKYRAALSVGSKADQDAARSAIDAYLSATPNTPTFVGAPRYVNRKGAILQQRKANAAGGN